MINSVKWMAIAFALISNGIWGQSVDETTEDDGNVQSETDSYVDEAFETIVSNLNQFSTEFYQEVSKNEAKNVICSPLSVAMVLMMAEYGADGKTAQEINSALHNSNNERIQSVGIDTLIDKLNNSGTIQLQLANKMFVANHRTIKPEFKAVTLSLFKSEIESLNFTNPADASDVINQWSEQQTNSRIKDIVKPQDFDGNTLLVMLNAVYFKGNWAKKFKKVEDKQFYIDEKTNKTVEMMNNVGYYRYGVLRELDAQFVELPYEQNSTEDCFSMIIILPNDYDGLKKVEAGLGNVSLNQLLSGVQQEVDLSLPKFKVESEIDLKSTLTNLNMKDMFEDSANFSKIVDGAVKVSKASQKAFIEVNEEGSEAAAVTGIQIVSYIYQEPITFYIDHPFYFVIVKRVGYLNGIPIFYGHYTG